MTITLKQAGIIAAIILATALGAIYFVKFESVLTSMLAFLACSVNGAAGWFFRGLYNKLKR